MSYDKKSCVFLCSEHRRYLLATYGTGELLRELCACSKYCHRKANFQGRSKKQDEWLSRRSSQPINEASSSWMVGRLEMVCTSLRWWDACSQCCGKKPTRRCTLFVAGSQPSWCPPKQKCFSQGVFDHSLVQWTCWEPMDGLNHMWLSLTETTTTTHSQQEPSLPTEKRRCELEHGDLQCQDQVDLKRPSTFSCVWICEVDVESIPPALHEGVEDEQ